MTRRTCFTVAAAALAGCARRPVFDIEEVPLADLAEGVRAGRLKARELVELYLERIGRIDRRLRSVIEINPDVRLIADKLDSATPRGPLHGVPILVKDNIDTGDGMMTTAGSLALEGWRAPADAPLVKRLRDAGAVILGKTNLSEWANFRSSRSTSGWSGRGGQTCNAYDAERNPSGSSSGSAVAVAANLCAGAIGTETDGSVVSPASVNGIVGVKPTVGLIPGEGIIPISHTQDTAGPMTRTVRDAALLLEALAGRRYVDALNPDSLKGARIGVARHFVKNHLATDALLNQCVEVLRKAGAVVVDVELPSIGDAEFTLMLYEFKHGIDLYLSRLPAGKPRSLKELIEYNRRNASREMPWFGQEVFEMAVTKGPLTDQAYLDAKAACVRLSRTEGIDALLAKHSLDAISGITESPAWRTDMILGDHFIGGSSTPAAVAGYPHVTVPAGFVHNLPVGWSFFGPAWSERKMLALAYAFETATSARRKPRV